MNLTGRVLFSGAGGVDTFTTDNQGRITHNQNFTYTLDKPGLVADRQEAPHPHQALVDPTGKFAIVPDLGADLLRVYSIGTSGINEMFPSWVKTPEGTGPRHAVFYPPGTAPATHLFVVGELSNKIITYKVTYGDYGQISLDNIASVSTFGSDAAAAAISSAGAGEIDISVGYPPPKASIY
jgi:6-phosphogluconolactonase (cycloisomerase 2 family)